ncbi:putative ABC transport system ATP-binding protein [Lachnospiraceae bacterium XBB2008]|nr:putative ABC transport system ATP-binding protein [Lachnospiraceae bacterium XBB2008]
MDNVIIKTKGIKRAFDTPAGKFWALKGIDAEIPEGKFVILRGRSGSGKTTYMNIINSLDDPTEGDVFIDGVNLKDLSEKERENLRRTKMGFVFQSVSLIPSLNAFQNVEFSMRMAGMKINKDTARRVEECLKLVGLGNRMNHMSAEMSGGEQQRVAIARALAHKPSIIFADEPTAELDSAMAARVTEIFKEMTRKEGITVLMTTHDVGLMGAADMMIELDNGERINAGE